MRKLVLYDEFMAAAARKLGISLNQGLTDKELAEALSEARAQCDAAMADFYAANPGAVLVPEDAALVAELEKVLAEIDRIDGNATAVSAPTVPREIPEIPPAEVQAPPEEELQTEEEPERPAEQAATKTEIDVSALPGYGRPVDDGVLRPMSEQQAQRELRRYRGRIEAESWEKNPLSWWGK